MRRGVCIRHRICRSHNYRSIWAGSVDNRVAAVAEAVAEEALGTGTDPPALFRSLSAEKKWNNQWENRYLCRTQQSSACKISVRDPPH
jgi:hypothetical protein